MLLINFYTQVIMLLPPFLRQPGMIAWLWAMAKPVSDNAAVFLSDSVMDIQAISTTGQAISLESMLNKLFNAGFAPSILYNTVDYSGGGIYIVNTPNAVSFVYLFLSQELQPPLFIYANSDPFSTYVWSTPDYLQQLNFIVFIPASLPCDHALIRQVVDYYKPISINYTIQTY